MMNRELLLRVRSDLGRTTPLWTDCGRGCGAACCRPDEEGRGGVYLFPGEEALLSGIRWGHIVPHAFGPMLICDGACDRTQRPLACRIFPLTPVETPDGRWRVRVDIRAQAVCPLACRGAGALRPDFVRAVRAAAQRIAADPEGLSFLRRWQALEQRYHLDLGGEHHAT